VGRLPASHPAAGAEPGAADRAGGRAGGSLEMNPFARLSKH